MIVTVCLNPAIDVTYRVPELRHGAVHRVANARWRAGGKGTNVARVLTELGAEVRLIAPIGGDTGREFGTELRGAGVALCGIATDRVVRRSVAVVDQTDATVFNEAGAELDAATWTAVLAELAGSLVAGDVLVLSGSVPPGTPADGYAELTRLAHDRGAAVIVDAEGSQLGAALAARPELVKPNAHEVGGLLGTVIDSDERALAAAGELRGRGAGAVVISRGADGLIACTANGAWAVRPGEQVSGNPTGAGDALTAALARGLPDVLGRPVLSAWPQLLADVVATAAGAAAAELAGSVDTAVRDRVRAGVRVVELR